MTDTVLPLQRPTEEPEQILRNALARCAEIRSRGAEPYVIVMMAQNHELPMFVRSWIFTEDIAACSVRMQIEAIDHLRETYAEQGQ